MKRTLSLLISFILLCVTVLTGCSIEGNMVGTIGVDEKACDLQSGQLNMYINDTRQGSFTFESADGEWTICDENGLYLGVHPEEGTIIRTEEAFSWIFEDNSFSTSFGDGAVYLGEGMTASAEAVATSFTQSMDQENGQQGNDQNQGNDQQGNDQQGNDQQGNGQQQGNGENPGSAQSPVNAGALIAGNESDQANSNQVIMGALNLLTNREPVNDINGVPISDYAATVEENGSLTAYEDFLSAWNYANNHVSIPLTITLYKNVGNVGEITMAQRSASLVLEMNGCTINRALRSSQDGGSVFSLQNAGKLTIKNGTITGGNAKWGGGFFVNNAGVDLTLENVIITGNNVDYNGGGICLGPHNAKVTLRNVTIEKNSAGENGGGLIWEERNGNTADLTLEETVIIRNNENGTNIKRSNWNLCLSGYAGDGIKLHAEKLSDDSEIFFGNLDGTIDGVIGKDANNCKTVVKACGTLMGLNSLGEAWYLANIFSNVEVIITMQEDAIANDGKFGIFGELIPVARGNDAPLTLDLNGNTIDRGLKSSQDNGCVFKLQNIGELTIKNGTITGGNGKWGSGIFVNSAGAVLTVENVLVTGNNASANGGGICLGPCNAKVTLNNVTVENNSAGENCGGLLWEERNGNAADLTLMGTVIIRSNTQGTNSNAMSSSFCISGTGALDSKFHAQKLSDDSDISFGTLDGTISGSIGKEANDYKVVVKTCGAAMGLNSLGEAWKLANILLNNSVIITMNEDVVATNGKFGEYGALTLNNRDNNAPLILDLNGNTIDRGLKSSQEGGSVFSLQNAGVLTIKNGTITGGNSNWGGGIFVNNAGMNLTLENVLITGNKASESGGGICLGPVNSNVTLENVTIENNSSDRNGGGLLWEERNQNAADLTLMGTVIIRNNTKGTNRSISNSNFCVSDADVSISRLVLGELMEGSEIWTTLGAGRTGVFTEDLGDRADILKRYFHSDVIKYQITNVNNCLAFADITNSIQVTAGTETKEFSYFKEAMDYANSRTTVTVTVVLCRNVYGDELDGEITVAKRSDDAPLTIDMGGFAIDRALNNAQSNGSVFCLDTKAAVIIKNGTISGGYGDWGSGIFVNNEGVSLTVENVLITGNAAAHNGGGICLGPHNAKVTLQNVTIENNSAGENCGGLLWEERDGKTADLTLKGTVIIRDNTQGTNSEGSNRNFCISGTGNSGKGLHAEELSNDSDIIFGNLEGTAYGYMGENTENAGVIATTCGTLMGFDSLGEAWSLANVFSGVKVSLSLREDAIAQNGKFGTYGELTLKDRGDDAALILDLGGFTIDRGLTEARGSGSVFSLSGSGSVTIQNGTVTGGNNLSNAGGFYVNNDKLDLTLINLTITGNKAKDTGGGMYIATCSGSVTLKDVTVTGNEGVNNGGGVFWDGTDNKISKLVMKGKVIISDNSSTLAKNFCLPRTEKRCQALDINELTAGSNIGIADVEFNKDGVTCFFTESLGSNANDLKSYFVSDQLQCEIAMRQHDRRLSIFPILGSVNVYYTKQEVTSYKAEKGEDGQYHNVPATYNTVEDYYPCYDMKEAWDFVNSHTDVPVVIKLFRDIDQHDDAGMLELEPRSEGASVTIDLNGYTIDRGLASANPTTNGCVFLLNISGEVTIKNGTITGGSNTYGGAIYVKNDDMILNLENLTITGNRANYGGGIYLDVCNAKVTLDNVTVTGNRASEGAGIRWSRQGNKMADLTLKGSIIVAENGSDGKDFVIPSAEASLDRLHTEELAPSSKISFIFTDISEEGTIGTRGTEDNYTVETKGLCWGMNTFTGAMWIADRNPLTSVTLTLYDDLTVDSSINPVERGEDALLTFDLKGYTINRGLTASAQKGSVFDLTSAGSLMIANGTITGGFNTNGGGIYANNDALELTLENVIITGNKASENGGGMYIDSCTARVTLRNVTITGNDAGNGQGGIHWCGHYNIKTADLTLSGVVVIQDNTGNEDRNLSIPSDMAKTNLHLEELTEGSDIGVSFDNHYGGCLADNLGDRTDIFKEYFSSDLIRCHVQARPGQLHLAIYAEAARVTMNGDDTPCKSYEVAWEYINKFTDIPVTVTLMRDIAGDEITEIVPAARQSDAPLVIDLNGYTIKRWIAAPSEEGMVFQFKNEGTYVVKNGTVTGGRSTGNGGGILISSDTAKVTIENVTITGNESSKDGGGIYIASGDAKVVLADSIVTGNIASGNGGGIRFCNENDKMASLTLKGIVTIKDNIGNGNLTMDDYPRSQIRMSLSQLATGSDVHLGFLTKAPYAFTMLSGRANEIISCLTSDWSELKIVAGAGNLNGDKVKPGNTAATQTTLYNRYNGCLSFYPTVANAAAGVYHDGTWQYSADMKWAWQTVNAINDRDTIMMLFKNWVANTDEGFGSGYAFKDYGGALNPTSRDNDSWLTVDLNGYSLIARNSMANAFGRILHLGNSANVSIRNGVLTGGWAGDGHSGNYMNCGGAVYDNATSGTLELVNLVICNNRCKDGGGGIYYCQNKQQMWITDVTITGNGTSSSDSTNKKGRGVFLAYNTSRVDNKVRLKGCVRICGNDLISDGSYPKSDLYIGNPYGYIGLSEELTEGSWIGISKKDPKSILNFRCGNTDAVRSDTIHYGKDITGYFFSESKLWCALQTSDDGAGTGAGTSSANGWFLRIDPWIAGN